MAQVEGGDLLVIQRGQDLPSAAQPRTRLLPSSPVVSTPLAGAMDRGGAPPTRLAILVRSKAWSRVRSCAVLARKLTLPTISTSTGNRGCPLTSGRTGQREQPVRSSDLFLSVQAVRVDADNSLFAGTTATEKEKEASAILEDDADEQIYFAVYVLDPVHEIQFSTVSQPIPAKWAR